MKVTSVDCNDQAAANRVAGLAVDREVSDFDYVRCAQ
jgi:hypothetical protein